MGLFDRFRRQPKPEAPGNSTPPVAPAFDAVEQVMRYHQATKHHPMRYARGPAGLNWDTQPNPFRRYEGTEVLALHRGEPRRPVEFDSITREGRVDPVPVDMRSLSELFRFALGLSAWKEYQQSRWSLRVNPSSGNLHPTEGYLLCGPLAGDREGGMLAHYAPRENALEVRSRVPVELWREACGALPADVFFVGLSSILWREEWKYGERAYRYCNHDVGHAIAAITYSAACLGWKVRMVDHLGTEELAGILGLADFGAAEPEEADVLLAVFPGEVAEAPRLPGAAVEGLSRLPRAGRANQLSPDHLEWDAIYACAFASEKPPTEPLGAVQRPSPYVSDLAERSLGAQALLLQRRSVQHMDGKTHMPLADFLRTLERCMPSRGQVPFDSLPWDPCLHLALFVHRVDGLEPGLYALLRSAASGERLRAAVNPDFLWQSPAEAPENLPLFLLKAGSFKSMAAGLSCDQAIAGESCFSLGMIAEFAGPLKQHGAWIYPRLYWEAGLIGQVLYLEAEAAGLRGTGIGCYHDDPVHQQLGLTGAGFQSLYHFTVGGPLEDTRLRTLAPYGELEGGPP